MKKTKTPTGRGKLKLRELYKVFKEGDNVLIMINADPDSMASALAMKRLLWRRVASVTISNINVVSRPDNMAMIRLIGIRMRHVEDINTGDYHRFVLLDSQPNHNDYFMGTAFDVVIDHHPDTGYSAGYSDIRPEYGATASIMTEYLRAAGIKPSTKLATALFHAIKTDTNNFERKTLSEDMLAFQFLFRHTNLHLARKIEQAEVRLSDLKYYSKALAEKTMRKGKLFAHLGTVENPDICVHIADFFMRIEAVQWSIVSGIYDNALIVIFRNDGIRKDAGKVSSESFGDMGNAGGHKSAARAEIPMAGVKNEVKPFNAANLSRWIKKRVN